MSELIPPDQALGNTPPSLERLHPCEVQDGAGFNRLVYNFGEQRVVFKGREELPVVPGFEEAVVAGGSEVPRFSEQGLESGSDTSSIMANQTPLGVVETGIALGIDIERFTRMQEEIKNGTYSYETFELIDDIMACRLINSNGQLSQVSNPGAEALVLLARSGDEIATKDLNDRKAALKSRDQTRRSDAEVANSSEPLDPDNVLLVRRTGYEPEITEDGVIRLRSTADITGGAYVRPSIHFSLDAPVVGHLAGNWEAEKYTIVDSLGSVMVRRERPPSNLASNDTWFEQNPGECLELPTGHVFIADPDHKGEPRREGTTTVYNPESTKIEELVSAERRQRGIDSPGPSVTGHGWPLGSEKTEKLSALAQRLGVPQTGHVYGDEIKIENRLGEEVSFADQLGHDPQERANMLFAGNLRLDWEKLSNEYIFQDEFGADASVQALDLTGEDVPFRFIAQYGVNNSSLNSILASCSDEMRRNFYASGLSIPRVTIIRGIRKDVSMYA